MSDEAPTDESPRVKRLLQDEPVADRDDESLRHKRWPHLGAANRAQKSKRRHPHVAFGTTSNLESHQHFEIPTTSILHRQVIAGSLRASLKARPRPFTAVSSAEECARTRPASAMSVYPIRVDTPVVVQSKSQRLTAEELGLTASLMPSRATVPYDKYGERVRDGDALETFHFANPFFTYHGQFSKNVKHGTGRLTLGDGSTYVGEFKDGEIDGEGVKTWPDGSTYRGYFKCGEMHGRGIHQSGCATYEGDFCRNVRHGSGTLRQPHVTYVGDFQDHKFHGYGVLKSAAKAVSGHFARGLLQGTARVKYANGDAFSGDYSEDTEHGNGAFWSAATKVTYVGQMIHGARASIPNCLILRELRAAERTSLPVTSPAAISMAMRARMSLSRAAVFSPKAALRFEQSAAGSAMAPEFDDNADEDDDRASNGSQETAAVSVAPTTAKSMVSHFAPSPVIPPDGNYSVALAWGRPFAVRAGRRFEIAVVEGLINDAQFVNPPAKWPVGSTLGTAPVTSHLTTSAASPGKAPMTPLAGSLRPAMFGVRAGPGGQRGTAATVASVTLSTVRYGLFTVGEVQLNETGRGVTFELYAINPRRKDVIGVLAAELQKTPTALAGDVIYHPSEPQGGGPESFSALATRQALVDGTGADPFMAEFLEQIFADVQMSKPQQSPHRHRHGHGSFSCWMLDEAMAASVSRLRAAVESAGDTSFFSDSRRGSAGDIVIAVPPASQDVLGASSELPIIDVSPCFPTTPAPVDVLRTTTDKGVAKFSAWLSPHAPAGEYLAVVRFATNFVAPRPNGGTVPTDVKPLIMPFYVVNK